MNKKIVSFFAIIFCIATFAMTGKAHYSERADFKIPFQFNVGKQSFPAGSYYAERVYKDNSGVVVLRQENGKAAAVLIVMGGSFIVNEQFKLSFKNSDAGYALLGLSRLDEKDASRVLVKKKRRAPEIESESSTYVLSSKSTRSRS